MDQTLLQYLSTGLPRIPVDSSTSTRNTTNPHYNANDIVRVISWTEFNYSSILRQYGAILRSTRIRADPFMSPPAVIRDEPQFNLRFAELVLPRIRRSLRASFERLAPEIALRGLSPITIDGGSAAAIIDRFRADTAFVVVGGSSFSGHNRAPGGLKVSWKWRSVMRYSRARAVQREYKTVLAQVNYYMRQHNARHGYILTDAEFVAVKRLGGVGRLALSAAIPWASGGSRQMSVLLALWYLGMLAADDGNWAIDT